MNPFNQSADSPGSANSMSDAPLRHEDVDFARSARKALTGDRVVGANLLLWLIVAVIAALIFWANKAELDEVTKGEGKVIPSSSIQTIQNLEGGIIAEIFVKEGAVVEKGATLVRIDDTMSNAAFRENLAQAEALQASLARLQAESEGLEEIQFAPEIVEKRPELIARERSLFAKRLEELGEQKSTLESSLRLTTDQLDMTIPLVKKNIVAPVEQIQLEREKNELEGKLKEITNAFQRSAAEQFNEIKAKLESLEEAIKGRESRVRRTVVTSPVDGIVNKLHATTLGGVVQPGEPILDIVPRDDTLLVEAKIRPSDIAFLSPGQKAVIKLTAYDFALYGGLDGIVEHISADTIEDEIEKEHFYQIKVRNNTGKLMKNGEELPIIPGMVAQVDVLTGRRTVLQYLTKPFHRMRFNALRER